MSRRRSSPRGWLLAKVASGLGSHRVKGLPRVSRDHWGPPGGVCGLAEAMRAALDSPVAEPTRMGAAGRRKIEEHHDSSKEGARLAKLFEAHAAPS